MKLIKDLKDKINRKRIEKLTDNFEAEDVYKEALYLNRDTKNDNIEYLKLHLLKILNERKKLYIYPTK